ncbi:family 10 glycosylhydrolase [bacterium]|nr:family 10 glycosylhydrolase [bacterium]
MRYILILIGISLMWVQPGAAANSNLSAICRQRHLQGRIIWFDAEANLRHLSSRKGVAETVRRCRDANINTIIVDVKPLSGLVLYRSRIAPRLTSLDGAAYPRDYDLLKAVVDEGHKAGIAVHASINVFSEGSQKAGGGPALRNRDWQCVQYDMDRAVCTSDGQSRQLHSADGPYPGNICAYGSNSALAGDLPPDTTYVRVSGDGQASRPEQITGRAHLAAPDGGFILLADKEAGAWLKHAAESGAKFTLKGEAAMRRVSETDNVHHAVFVNPCNPDVQAYELSIVREIVEHYDVDGIVLDRMRYPNIYTDFSDVTRKQFESFIGRKVSKWPEDVFARPLAPGDIERGPLFKEWLKFRAQVIRDFLAQVRHTVKSIRRGVRLGVYVGSWYPVYFDVGVNWGSPSHSAPDLDWWPDGYEETGYADLADYICTGCYYTYPTRREAQARGEEDWKSVEAAAEESMNAIKDETFVYGSLYLRQYNGRPDKFLKAVRQCLAKTQGCMLFDLVYVRDYDWWSVLKQAFPKPMNAPHEAPALLSQSRNSRSTGS